MGYADWLRKYHQEDAQVNNDLWALMWKTMTQHHFLIATAAHSSGLFLPFHSTHHSSNWGSWFLVVPILTKKWRIVFPNDNYKGREKYLEGCLYRKIHRKTLVCIRHWILILTLEGEDNESYKDWENMGSFFVIF